MVTNNRDKILDISVNLARVSDWILKENKQKLVDQFMQETAIFLENISRSDVSTQFQPTYDRFKLEFKKLLKDRYQADKEEWAERALTWANILQHRAKYA